MFRSYWKDSWAPKYAKNGPMGDSPGIIYQQEPWKRNDLIFPIFLLD
jgi:hypothetical protein